MARMTSHLEKRGSTYYARIDTPTDLVAHYGTTTRKVSLRTKNEREAKDRLAVKIAQWRAEFADVRSRRDITADDKADAVWQHYQGSLARDEQARRHLPTSDDIAAASRALQAKADRGEIVADTPLALLDATSDVLVMKNARAYEANNRRVKLDLLREHLVSGETALIEDETAAYIERHKLLVAVDSDEGRDLSRQLMRAEIEFLERSLERDRGDYSGTPRDPIVKPIIGTAREAAKSGETILELFDAFARENPNQVQKDRLDQSRRDVSLFVDLVGPSCPVHRIDKKAVREWKQLLMRFPVKATETKAFAGMTLSQIVRENEQVGKPVIAVRTVNRYLSSLGAFCNWLSSHGYIPANPLVDMYLTKQKKVSTRPFTPDELNVLFRSPLFTGCQSAEEWRNVAKPGNVLIRDHRYWIPLVMLFSGARPAEIAQLNVADVFEQHGRWTMHITTEGDGEKSLKTEGSMRVVPIHSELIRLGFIEFHRSMKKRGETRLFPEAERNSRGQMIAEFSREFGRYLGRLGMKEGRGLSLYSFRHGVADAWRRTGLLDPQFGFLLGHQKSGTTSQYGLLPQGILDQRITLVEAIAYPDLDLKHLHTA